MKNCRHANEILWKNISELPYFRGFLRAVEGGFYQNIEVKEPILDLGCGDGHFSSVTFHHWGFKLIGVDVNIKNLLEAKQYEIYSHLICARGDQLPFRNTFFRTIISNSVLEHIQNVNAVILEANRVMGLGSKLIICVPNDYFTKNLSIAKFFDSIYLKHPANWYRKLFNKISRHYHPDSLDMWLERLQGAGFKINDFWNYFTQESLAILEWGHYFGFPTLINKKLFGRWILFQNNKNPILRRIYKWLENHIEKDQKAIDGAYSFIISTKDEKRTDCV